MGVLVLVRHGQASFHEADYDKLSPLGEQQARRLGEYWAARELVFHHIFTGPLQRQRRSAEIVREAYRDAGQDFPEIEVIDALAEMPVERLAKRFMPQLCAEDEAVMEHMNQFVSTQDRAEKEKLFQKCFEKLMLKWALEEYLDAEIETFNAFASRVKEWLGVVMAERKNGQHVAAFTSGGPTAVAVHAALGTTFESTLELVWQLRNAALTEFLFTDGRFSLNSFNNVPHLEPDMWTYR